MGDIMHKPNGDIPSDPVTFDTILNYRTGLILEWDAGTPAMRRNRAFVMRKFHLTNFLRIHHRTLYLGPELYCF